MTFEKGLHAAKTHTTRSWKHIFMKHPLLHLVFASLVAGVAAPSTIWAQEHGLCLTTSANDRLSLRCATQSRARGRVRVCSCLRPTRIFGYRYSRGHGRNTSSSDSR